MIRSVGTSLAAALAISSAPASAQPAENRPFSASGALEICECRFGDHVVPLEAGRRYEIAATTAAFDAMLRVYRNQGSDPLAEDDDSGGDRNPRLVFTAPESGDYLVRVTSFGAEGAGPYDLQINALEALPAPITRATASETLSWQVYEGALEGSDPVEGGMRFDDYAIDLEAGQSAIIRLDSEGFDPVAKVYAADQRGIQELASDDDSGGGLNAFLLFNPDRSGTYIVRVSAYSTDGTGPYRLRIAR